MSKNLKHFLNFNSLIIALTVIFIVSNAFFLTVFILRKYSENLGEYLEPGSQFSSFKKELVGIKRAGYLTDKDMSRKNNDGFFLQAQYYLAPTILELNKVNDEFNIIDSLDLTFIISTMRSLNSKRVANNEFGQALIKRRF